MKSYSSFKKKNDSEFENIYQFVYKYVNRKLYNKVYPSEPTEKDQKIYNICCSLEWIEPKHIINNPNIIVENFLPHAIRNIKKMTFMKSPSNKIELIDDVLSLIKNTIVFSLNKSDLGMDDFIPILLFSIIKAKPTFLSSDINYIEMFLDSDLKTKKYGLILTMFQLVQESLLTISYKSLFEITEEEYKERVNEYSNVPFPNI